MGNSTERAEARADEVIALKCAQFGQMFRAGRIEEMVAQFYTEDAILEGQNLSPQRGRKAIEQVFEEARGVTKSITIDHEPPAVAGDIAYGNISNTNHMVDGTLEVHRGLMIWRNVGGSWFVERDFFFSMGPANLVGGRD